jgi:hypothetical protein
MLDGVEKVATCWSISKQTSIFDAVAYQAAGTRRLFFLAVSNTAQVHPA